MGKKRNKHPFVPVCPYCGKEMIATSDEYISCPDMHGKLIPRCAKFELRMRKWRRQEKSRQERLEWEKSLPIAMEECYRLGRKKVFIVGLKDGVFVLDHRDKSSPRVGEKRGIAFRKGIGPARFVRYASYKKQSEKIQ